MEVANMEILETLEEFGLTNYESKLYITVLASGVSNARTLSKKSGVPYGRIYSVLSSLESQGLLEEQKSRPKKFLAVEPRFVLKKLLDMKGEEMKSLIQKASVVEDKLNAMYGEKPKESLFWSVAVGSEKLKAHFEKLSEAKKELLAYVELHEKSILVKEKEIDEFVKVISDLANNRVVIKILIGYKESKHLDEIFPMLGSFLKLVGNIQVKTTKSIMHPFDVIDGEKVQLKVRNPAKPEEYFASIYVWQKEFAGELREKFNEMWNAAFKLKIVMDGV